MIDFTELPDDGVKFEQFARELLVRSGFDVHWTGVGPDGGRDLTVVETAKGTLATFQRRWLVSCKHHARSGKSVGVDDISNIVDACEAVGASGFLLVCSTQPTSSAVRRFEEIEGKGKLIVRYWDGVEIEKRLVTPQAFALIHLFFPASSRGYAWQVYATYSPSLWAANHRDYFLYLASRTAHTFPSLAEVEEIVRRLESVAVPAGSEWNQHYIRPRAVYYDNKHEQFTVFADYLYPEGQEKKVISPADLNKTLKDGEVLYPDGSFITFWDIRYVATKQISDHFHLDHKDYYEPYIHQYSIGLSRDRFLSEMRSRI